MANWIRNWISHSFLRPVSTVLHLYRSLYKLHEFGIYSWQRSFHSHSSWTLLILQRRWWSENLYCRLRRWYAPRIHLSSADRWSQVILLTEFQLTDSGECNGQSRYVKDLLERFDMLECKPTVTPCVLQRSTIAVPYRELVGGLNCLATCTRPDMQCSSCPDTYLALEKNTDSRLKEFFDIWKGQWIMC